MYELSNIVNILMDYIKVLYVIIMLYYNALQIVGIQIFNL